MQYIVKTGVFAMICQNVRMGGVEAANRPLKRPIKKVQVSCFFVLAFYMHFFSAPVF